MKNWNILQQKTVQAGPHQVQAQRHDDPAHEKPHQVLFSVTIQETERAELWAYPLGVTGNPDADYAGFNQFKAQRLVDRFIKQLGRTSNRVAKLAAE